MVVRLLLQKQWLEETRILKCPSRSKRRSSSVVDVPIAIVGGGPSGLMMSIMLSKYGAPSVLFEAQSAESRFRHPQAHFLNTRTMEILRHELPIVYDRVKEAMPVVENWRYFQFGYSCSSGIMARLVHPVDQPLDIQNDANGVLMPSNAVTAKASPTTVEPLSACTVGHLAQHTFSRILWEAAQEYSAPETRIQYDTKVSSVALEDDNQYVIRTECGAVYRSPVVVACDGSNSQLRKSWGIGWNGQEVIQDLINIHFTTSLTVANRLPPAMLYSVFSPKVVGMMVCHSPGEYVLQVPYFPPYQTVEEDFNQEAAHEIVTGALGFSDDSVEIKSVRSWSMSSVVASRYFSHPGGILVGDAAHVFPPAGGFGMNTGIQDAHNLAWRLALCHHNKDKAFPSLVVYDQERRPIAQQNAALSVRNYERVLNVTKACYLDRQHPDILIRMLDKTSFLPLSSRQSLFRSLLSTAMMSLSALEDTSNLYTRHVTSNLRRVLGNGEGLPLLFPSLELGFAYGHAPQQDRTWKNDTIPTAPRIEVGGLMPHVELRVISCKENYQNLRPIVEQPAGRVVTLSDLPAQSRKDLPCFVLLRLGWDDDFRSDKIEQIMDEIYSKHGTVIRYVEVVSDGDDGEGEVVLLDYTSRLRNLHPDSAWLLIRPDGHLTAILTSKEPALDDLIKSLDQCLGHNL